MRYILNSDDYVKAVSFGADITFDGQDCAEYTGAVPAGYTSLEDWALQETEKLYRWKIVDGELTLDSSAVAPTDRVVDGYAITAYPTSKHSVGTSLESIPLNGTFLRIGSKLVLTDDGGIQCITDGVILLSGIVRMSDLSAGDKIAINYRRYRNGEFSGSYDQYASNVSGTSMSVNFPPKLLNVLAGDVFYLGAYNTTAARGTVAANSATYLTAQYLLRAY